MFRSIQRNEGWSSAIFLAGLVMTAGWLLAAAGYAEGLDATIWAGLGGLIAGLLLGWSAFRPGIAHLASAIYGTAWVGFLVGSTIPGDVAWRERCVEIGARFGHWLVQAVTGGTGSDAFVFVLLGSALFWILGYSAAWNTYRRVRAWRAVLPVIVTALVTVFYTGDDPLLRYLGLCALFAMLYLARTHTFEQESRWRRERVTFGPDLRYTMLQASLAIAVVSLLLVWAVPAARASPGLSATWRRVNRPWRTVQEEWQRLFSTVYSGSVVGQLEPFGATLALGGPRTETETVLMDVDVLPGLQTYWRGAIYAHYTGDEWQAVEQQRLSLIPNRQPPGLAAYTLRRTVAQTVTNYIPNRQLLVAAPEPVILDRDADALIDTPEDVGAGLEYLRLFSLVPLAAGEQYVVTSLISDADATSLREAGSSYPDWITNRYLQLPSGLPDRVCILADAVTMWETNNYDRAKALESHLRDTLTYDLNPPPLPEGQDFVDFLLFDSQRDSCNGYSSAMVVMARCLGIPARVAAGYAQGEYDSERAVYRVRGKDAHAWPELYFPDFGWIEFEPTVSQTPFVRPEAREPDTSDSVPAGAGRADVEEPGVGFGEPGSSAEWTITPLTRRPGPLFWIAGGIALAAGLALSAWWAVENVGFHGLSGVQRNYARLQRVSSWIGHPIHADTPYEWARGMCTSAPEAYRPIMEIVESYVQTTFAGTTPASTPSTGEEPPVGQVHEVWQRTRVGLWQSWMRRIVPVRWQRSTKRKV